MYTPSFAINLARWFVPWLCVFGVSSTLALAADVGLVHSFSHLPPAVPPADLNHVIDITVRYDAGPTTELRCITPPGIAPTVDHMEVRAIELRKIAVEMCSRLEPVVP